jgi:hypothetical protein
MNVELKPKRVNLRAMVPQTVEYQPACPTQISKLLAKKTESITKVNMNRLNLKAIVKE